MVIASQFFIGKTAFREVGHTVFDPGIYSLFERIGLFAYFLQHKMCVTALFSCRNVPVGNLYLLFYDILVHIIKCYTVCSDIRNFSGFKQIVFSCVFNYRCDIGRDKHFALSLADYQRTFFSCREYAVFVFSEHYAERISALYISNCPDYSINRVAVVVVVEQLCDSFRIGLAFKAVAL